MEIRIATKEDLKTIVELAEKMMDFHCSLDSYYGIYRNYDDNESFYKEELGRGDRFYLIAENEDGLPVGFSSASLILMDDPEAPKIGNLITNFVLEEYRGQGFGTAMFNKRMDWLKENNVSHVEMSVDAKNHHALSMWKKKGFKDYQYKLRLDL